MKTVKVYTKRESSSTEKTFEKLMVNIIINAEGS